MKQILCCWRSLIQPFALVSPSLPGVPDPFDKRPVVMLWTAFWQIGSAYPPIPLRPRQHAPHPQPQRQINPDQRIGAVQPLGPRAGSPALKHPFRFGVLNSDERIFLCTAPLNPASFPMDEIDMHDRQRFGRANFACQGGFARTRLAYNHHALHASSSQASRQTSTPPSLSRHA